MTFASNFAIFVLLVAADCFLWLMWYLLAVAYFGYWSTPGLQYRLDTFLNIECLHQNQSWLDGNWNRLFPKDDVCEEDGRIVQQFHMMTEYGDGYLTVRREEKVGQVGKFMFRVLVMHDTCVMLFDLDKILHHMMSSMRVEIREPPFDRVVDNK